MDSQWYASSADNIIIPSPAKLPAKHVVVTLSEILIPSNASFVTKNASKAILNQTLGFVFRSSRVYASVQVKIAAMCAMTYCQAQHL